MYKFVYLSTNNTVDETGTTTVGAKEYDAPLPVDELLIFSSTDIGNVPETFEQVMLKILFTLFAAGVNPDHTVATPALLGTR